MRRFRRTERGIAVRLGSAEAAILSRLPTLLGSVGAKPGDPAEARLYPNAYADEEASHELSRLTKPDLVAARGHDRDAFAAKLDEAVDGVELDLGEAEAWLRVLGEARLVLAARAGMLDDDAVLDDLSVDGPDVALIRVLGMLQGELTDELLAGMERE